jgi:hypothetical protein
MKYCHRCSTLKPLDRFYLDSSKSDGINSKCKDCCMAYRALNRDRRIEYDRNRAYGLSLEKHNELLSHGCYICGTHDDLCIDHDHKCCPGLRTCGKCIRGVLCRIHNIALGGFHDNVEYLQKAIDYLIVCQNVGM